MLALTAQAALSGCLLEELLEDELAEEETELDDELLLVLLEVLLFDAELLALLVVLLDELEVLEPPLSSPPHAASILASKVDRMRAEPPEILLLICFSSGVSHADRFSPTCRHVTGSLA